MHRWVRMVVCASFVAACMRSEGQAANQIVQQAVQTELAADDADHTRWLYLDVDRKPNLNLKQWVAETGKGDLKRVLSEGGKPVSEREQRSRIENYAQSSSAQEKQRKGGKQDDEQARRMLEMLPHAFLWTIKGRQNGRTTLHFTPDPSFHPPSYEARVFAAMEGEMVVDDAHHRIASLKGHLIHDVKFGGGLLGDLHAGGSFDVERRDTGHGEWQITETHVHIEGRALLFKSISDQEDDVKSRFKEISPGLSLTDAERLLMTQGE